MGFFDDLSEPYSRIVRAERDLAGFRPIGNDTHLGSPKIVRPKVLKPHSSDEQKTPRELVRVPFAFPDTAAFGTNLAHYLTDELEYPIVSRCVLGPKAPNDCGT
jgi:hypothetical protein